MGQVVTGPSSPDVKGIYSFNVPPGWRVIEKRADGVSYRVPGGRFVIASINVEGDGKRWVHLSMSHKSRMPTWPELVEMRDALLGGDVEAYQVCPPASRYVNLHERVLHLWACIDAPDGVLPRFEGVIDGVRTI
jgi:hypothetical protein